MRLNAEGEPINLEAVPHPRRRRREKKLMTMEEVNEKFPMQKYKSWVAGRAQEGLPTRGGVTAPSSRANSVLSADGIVPELPSQPRESTEAQDRPTTSATSAEKPEAGAGHEKKDGVTTTVVDAVPTPTNEVQGLATIPETHAENETEAPLDKTRTSHEEEDEDDDEHIDAALPPECLGTSGDTCAICIDTLEDDDDVRGLTCGHAFHAGCLDPWLTSRRACCPLCKADYYTPKPPRVDGPQPGDAAAGVVVVNLDDPNSRGNMPSRPGHTWLGVRGRGMVLPSRFGNSNQGQTGERSGRSRIGFFGRDRLYSASSPADPQPAPATEPESQPPGRFPALREAFPSRFVPFRRERGPSTEVNPSTGASTNEVTPSNLEAGLRPGPGQ
ncbi:hypothetical protein DL546_006433 [Coniochaeta pulveracea]|uniref:RING-type domain-containing protein n=1 Tax=Coniochaeta pulveracea TaxID=177199 RepID=A0A420YK55_9PEZI|nr:hypothetical protein DL546_006433 [Coniochaeta pulveracea]